MKFTEILFAATIITGLIWLIDIIFWRPRRKMYLLSSGPHSSIKEPLIVEYARAFFPILLIVFLLRSFLVEPFRIPSGSMRPTLVEGDFILVNKYTYGIRLPILGYKLIGINNPNRGDVIVFTRTKNGDSLDMIKRVIGLPGDRIQYKDKMILLNGKAIQQTFIKDTEDKDVQGHYALPVRELSETNGLTTHHVYVRTDLRLGNDDQNEIIVPEDCYFVMGDNRDNSDDSRFWGFVRDEDIMGRAIAIWMSWDSKENTVRWNRLFTAIH